MWTLFFLILAWILAVMGALVFGYAIFLEATYDGSPQQLRDLYHGKQRSYIGTISKSFAVLVLAVVYLIAYYTS